MKIYTKTGDAGQTSLANGHRVSKADAQIEAYGTADELNAYVGLLRVVHPNEQLQWIQNRLFDLGATLAAASLHLTDDDVQRLEFWIDEYQARLTPLKDFILPSGDEATCRCHVCRTVTRRLERRMLDCPPKEHWKTELQFVNRLSDYFFVLARILTQNRGLSEEIWQKK